MFGYITVNPGSLSKAAMTRYRGFYCGLCRTLRQRHGSRGCVTLSNDMTFLLVLLGALYEPEERTSAGFCVLRPVHRREYIQTAFSDYAADMNIVLAYYKCLDNWTDDRSAAGRWQAKALEGAFRRVRDQYPQKCEVIAECMREIGRLEAKGNASLDSLANQTGRILGEIYAVRADYWADGLRAMGEAMGRFVYMMDAYEDLPADLKKGRFNPLAFLRDQAQYESLCEDGLRMLIAESAEAFEALPLVQDADILRNVLYSGVWTRYAQLQPNAKQKGKLKETRTNP